MKNIFGNLFRKEFPGATQILNLPISHNPMRGRRLYAEGYNYNVVVYRCVDSIIKAMKGIEISVKQGDKTLEKHDVLKILKKPNPAQSFQSFITESFINRLIVGEMFVVTGTANDSRRSPVELWNLDPLEVSILPGKAMPRAYQHKVGGDTKTWMVDQLTGASDVFFWKGHNPDPKDRWRGMSPLFAASLAADTNNAGLRWNYSLLKKGARATGLVKYEGNPDEQTILRLRKWFKETMQGENNAGELAVLTGKGDFQEIGKSPKDMDYIKTLDMTTAFIAMAYGVPLPLVLNDAATFNNYKEAKELFYTDTILPLFEEFLSEFGGWLLPKFGLDDAVLSYDRDSIQALEGIRERRSNRMIGLTEAGIISPDEARVELGYDPRGGVSDMQYIPATMIPMEDAAALPEDEQNLKAMLLKQGYDINDIETALKGDSDDGRG